MSLTGSLADLSVEEILQLAALTRRSGVLEVRSGGACICVGFRLGAIVRVARSGAEMRAPHAAEGRPPWMRSLLELVGWERGEFRMASGVDPDEAWPGPEGLHVDPPLSPQFLALEGIRLSDERKAAGAGAEGVAAVAAPAALIVIDRDLHWLEKIKRALSAGGLTVHVFQRSDEGLGRLKQYLAHGALPALVLGAGVVDPLEPRRKPGWKAFAQRVHRIAPVIRIVVLSDDATAPDWDQSCIVPRPPAYGAPAEDIAVFLAKLRNSLGVSA